MEAHHAFGHRLRHLVDESYIRLGRGERSHFFLGEPEEVASGRVAAGGLAGTFAELLAAAVEDAGVHPNDEPPGRGRARVGRIELAGLAD